MGQRAGFGEGIEGPGVDIARLQADHRRPGPVLGERCGERLEPEVARIVRREQFDGIAADTEEAHRAQDRFVAALARKHAHGGRASEAAALHVEAARHKQLVARRAEGRRMRHLAAGHEGEGRRGGQAQELLEPGAAHLLDHRLGRAAGMGGRVLVPGRGQPIGREGHGERAADDPAEETPARGGEDAALHAAHEIVDDRERIARPLGQRAAQSPPELGPADRGADRPLVKAVEERDRVLLGASQDVGIAHVRHHDISPAMRISQRRNAAASLRYGECGQAGPACRARTVRSPSKCVVGRRYAAHTPLTAEAGGIAQNLLPHSGAP